MCIDDWRLGRLIRSKITPLSFAGGGAFTFPPNMQRVGVRVSISQSLTALNTGISITIDGQLVTYVFSSGQSMLFTLASDGDLPTKQIILTNIAAVTAVTGSIIEYTMPEEYIQAGLDQFLSQYKFKG